MSEEKKTTVRISDNYIAERVVSAHNAFTVIKYKAPEGETDYRELITVSARMGWERWDLPQVWLPAEVNWRAIGSVPPAEAAEFAKALAWAVREAKRIDKILQKPKKVAKA